MARPIGFLMTAAAPAIWGSTYLTTTELLPEGYPLTVAMLRALPAGLILLALTRCLPRGVWIWRSLVLGGLNFALFFWLLFVAAYALPGGVAATVGATQPLIVLVLSALILGQAIRPLSVVAGIGGVIGVALLVLGPQAALDPVGLLAAAGGAVSMACGVVMTRRWQPPVPALSFTAWQLTAGGLLLLPVALWQEPSLPPLEAKNIMGFLWLGIVGGALAYLLWFRGIAQFGPNAVAPLGLLSPLSAVLLGALVLTEIPTAVQMLGMVFVLGSVWLGQRVGRAPKPPESESGIPSASVRSYGESDAAARGRC